MEYKLVLIYEFSPLSTLRMRLKCVDVKKMCIEKSWLCLFFYIYSCIMNESTCD